MEGELIPTSGSPYESLRKGKAAIKKAIWHEGAADDDSIKSVWIEEGSLRDDGIFMPNKNVYRVIRAWDGGMWEVKEK